MIESIEYTSKYSVYNVCAKASHQDTHLCGILFDEPASSSRGIKSSLLDVRESVCGQADSLVLLKNDIRQKMPE